ncbi:16S rRNA (guanine(527)-N(7))-methyltransferase RsmG [Myxosarcina sp. GI1]|uniref:16S rRNA (guanine(527)-N(7))-methyltransferase RsmG n=1 Tax=Myxosarcina sp. GI1 TaxID=1541065 RepID=UPI0005658782|nr:16S rRNA (guanine(527)-N(7))-methyltransferase RsmG [Myxosarcina sp. GI1]
MSDSNHLEQIPELPNMIEIWQATLDWQPDRQQQQRFQRVYTEILKGNRLQNLTRISAPEAFWEKHLWDSLSGTIGIDTDRPCKAIDLGTGAGFPGIPLAIAYPHWQITLLDSTRKKIAFIETLISKLNLQNVKTIADRAETIGQQPNLRETYDLATIRAVSKASVCAEYALPLVKIGGLAILYRGSWSDTDTLEIESVAAQLGGKLEAVYPLETPLTKSIRHCIYLRKHFPTKKQFPRAIGIPDRQPLQTA